MSLLLFVVSRKNWDTIIGIQGFTNTFRLFNILFSILLLSSLLFLDKRSLSSLKVAVRNESERANQTHNSSPRGKIVEIISRIKKSLNRRIEAWRVYINIHKQTLVRIAFLIVFVAFFVLRIYFLLSNGNYRDDWFHIASGENIYQNGELLSIYKGDLYERGSYVSYAVALMFSIFGQTLFVAKLLPFIIGLLSFIILFVVIRKAFKSKLITVSALFLYAINPMVVTNHSYIRMYGFYELLFLLNTLAILYIHDWIQKKRTLPAMLLSISMACISVLFFYFSNDVGAFVILVPLVIYALYLFFTLRVKFSVSIKLRLLIILLVVLMALMLGGDRILVQFLVEDFEINNVNVALGFDEYLFANGFLFVLLILAFVRSFYNSNLKERINDKLFVIFLTTFVVILHLFSKEALRILRGTAYLWGVFYAVVVFSSLNLNRNLRTLFLVLTVLFGSFVSISYYQPGFFNFPRTYSDTSYDDYKSAYEFISDNLADSKFFLVESNTLPAVFYGLDYIEKRVELTISNTNGNYGQNPQRVVDEIEKIDLTNHINRADPRMHEQVEGELVESSTRYRVVKKPEALREEYIGKSQTCLVLRDYSEDFFINPDPQSPERKYIKENYVEVLASPGFVIKCREYK